MRFYEFQFKVHIAKLNLRFYALLIAAKIYLISGMDKIQLVQTDIFEQTLLPVLKRYFLAITV